MDVKEFAASSGYMNGRKYLQRMCGGRHLNEPYDWENDYVEVFTDILSNIDS